ncbi:IclR family transcriptional regulator [Cohnella sp. REN36]|uniref:IclR family transcriptional regulator n=1 Tax=Cohnella sp. REN36 TaxID=2887347 RepID=UPI001D152566|nr:IclR family transcriptional regulator [Cohnella sp. REN36]MCC3374722.1 IclR family transcriptional regulator [Cohnella sp. REN36]
MEKKYWVPALEKANAVLRLIADQPGKLRLIDLSKVTGIHKSSMFSLLHTMESLNWAVSEKDGTYSLGSAMASFGNAFFKKFSLIDQFAKEARPVVERIRLTVQLGKLEGDQVLYLAKEEAVSPIRLVSEPGMRIPAHATALGKVMLSELDEVEWNERFPTGRLTPLTPNTISDRSLLWASLQEIKRQKFAYDLQESILGFCCVASPVRDETGRVIAAVSCSMPSHMWEEKKEDALREIQQLAGKLSLNPENGL